MVFISLAVSVADRYDEEHGVNSKRGETSERKQVTSNVDGTKFSILKGQSLIGGLGACSQRKFLSLN